MPSPIIFSSPAYAPLIVAPVVVDAPIVYTPAMDWPGYAPLASADSSAPVIGSTGNSTAPVETTTAMAPAGLAEQEAWDLLSTGNEALAEERFAQVLNVEPDNARARAGYGLASALAGRESTAVWALRDAVSLRPDVLESLPLMPAARSRLTDLARSLEVRAVATPQPNAVDELFLAAALRAAVGDKAQAAYAMEQAAKRGALDAAKADFRARLASQLASGL